MPAKKHTSTKPQSAAHKTPPKPLSIPREHPAFMLALGKAAFPTKPILRAWRRLRDAMRDGDEAAEERAVEHLSYMLYMPPEHEWLEKTGLPSPRDMEELKERMALAGFSPDKIESCDWTPQSISPIILGKGRIPKTPADAVHLHGNLPPHLEKDDVKILESLARRKGIVAYQQDIDEVGRDRASERLRYLSSVGYVQNPPGKTKRGWMLTAAGLRRLEEIPAVD